MFPSKLSKLFHLDAWLIFALTVLITFGLIILYSASGLDWEVMHKQLARFLLGTLILLIFAQIPPKHYYLWAPWIYGLGILLLLAVLGIGHIGKGAQRWLNLGPIRFQPSELMKIAAPMMLAWYFHHQLLPPPSRTLWVSSVLLGAPVVLTAIEPDLGTAIVILLAGGGVLVLAGLKWRLLGSIIVGICASAPLLWHFMHDYQKNRVLTFFNPERDPLGAGYHIIQSKIAIGSGGFWGKGWLQGTQAHLQFLPEHATDFIFALVAEEFGLVGCLLLILVFGWIGVRCLTISLQAQETFTRLLTGSLTLTFCCSVIINIGMVIGIIPVVGLPLPLISYGGTSMVTVMASFGILMSVHSHKKLVDR